MSNQIRFTPAEAEKIRHEYFFERKPNGKRYSIVDMVKRYGAGEQTIRHAIFRTGVYKPQPEVMNQMLMSASEALRLFMKEVPHLPSGKAEVYASTTDAETILRIKRSKRRGNDGNYLYEVDTIRRTK